jgi:hypothetical protein
VLILEHPLHKVLELIELPGAATHAYNPVYLEWI